MQRHIQIKRKVIDGYLVTAKNRQVVVFIQQIVVYPIGIA